MKHAVVNFGFEYSVPYCVVCGMGLGYTPRKLPEKMGKSDSTGLIGQREIRVRDLPGTSQE
jgi:hypothetical protein